MVNAGSSQHRGRMLFRPPINTKLQRSQASCARKQSSIAGSAANAGCRVAASFLAVQAHAQADWNVITGCWFTADHWTALSHTMALPLAKEAVRTVRQRTKELYRNGPAATRWQSADLARVSLRLPMARRSTRLIRSIGATAWGRRSRMLINYVGRLTLVRRFKLALPEIRRSKPACPSRRRSFWPLLCCRGRI